MNRFLQCAALAGLLAAFPVEGGNVHYLHNRSVTCGPPSASVSGPIFNWFCGSGLIAGLGNEDIQVVVSYTVSAPTFCHNQGNPSNIVPGQNPAVAAGGQAVGIPKSEGKNGSTLVPTLQGTFVLNIPDTFAAGCPNNNWTVTLGPIDWNAHYSFQQPPGVELAKLSFDF